MLEILKLKPKTAQKKKQESSQRLLK
jgi:hypothetical protein